RRRMARWCFELPMAADDMLTAFDVDDTGAAVLNALDHPHDWDGEYMCLAGYHAPLHQYVSDFHRVTGRPARLHTTEKAASDEWTQQCAALQPAPQDVAPVAAGERLEGAQGVEEGEGKGEATGEVKGEGEVESEARGGGKEVGGGAKEVGGGAKEVGGGAKEVGGGAKEVGGGAKEVGEGRRRWGEGRRRWGEGRRRVGGGAKEVGHGGEAPPKAHVAGA
ncbi:unnamed protein product, partial [Closterium sp. Naga37s-1]